MTNVEIEYCVPCGHRNHAVDVQEAILEKFGQEIDSVALVTGDGGVFKIRVDGETVFDKADDEFDVDTIIDRVSEEHAAAA
jgi:selenoprotein W-related protein